MFANLAKRLSAFFVTTEDQERDAYLASSADLADLERRMYSMETNYYPYSLYSSGAQHDWKV
jgi:hypothetical protein